MSRFTTVKPGVTPVVYGVVAVTAGQVTVMSQRFPARTAVALSVSTGTPPGKTGVHRGQTFKAGMARFITVESRR